VLRRKAGNSTNRIVELRGRNFLHLSLRLNKIIGLTPWKRKIMSIRIQLLAYQALSERIAVKAF